MGAADVVCDGEVREKEAEVGSAVHREAEVPADAVRSDGERAAPTLTRGGHEVLRPGQWALLLGRRGEVLRHAAHIAGECEEADCALLVRILVGLCDEGHSLVPQPEGGGEGWQSFHDARVCCDVVALVSAVVLARPIDNAGEEVSAHLQRVADARLRNVRVAEEAVAGQQLTGDGGGRGRLRGRAEAEGDRGMAGEGQAHDGLRHRLAEQLLVAEQPGDGIDLHLGSGCTVGGEHEAVGVEGPAGQPEAEEPCGPLLLRGCRLCA